MIYIAVVWWMYEIILVIVDQLLINSAIMEEVKTIA